jgi:hypothetical protein
MNPNFISFPNYTLCRQLIHQKGTAVARGRCSTLDSSEANLFPFFYANVVQGTCAELLSPSEGPGVLLIRNGGAELSGSVGGITL